MQSIDVNLLKNMLISGSNNLNNQYKSVDSLNVFPIPDGDTGTNMSLTLKSGIAAIINENYSTVGNLMKDFSRGLLMGARGNSGVILSQIFRGFSESLGDSKKINVAKLSEAFLMAKVSAYKAVASPVEGTILTIINESSIALKQYVDEAPKVSIKDAFLYFLRQASITLEKTPTLLPVLKEAGVIDSGGAGLVIFLEGCLECLKGKMVQLQADSFVNYANTNIFNNINAEENFGYCCEFIAKLNENQEINLNIVKSELEHLGDSLVLVHDADILKVHIHSLSPGTILNYGQKLGEFISVKIENMSLQHTELIKSETTVAVAEHDNYIIAVANGEGVENMFVELRVDHVIKGGQTMNPSAQDFFDAISKIKAKNIFLLPNNSNIILTADQVASSVEGSNCVVIPSLSIQEGIGACRGFNPEASLEENITNMTEMMKQVKSGAITKATKSTKINGVSVIADDYVGIANREIAVSNRNLKQTVRKLIDKLIDIQSSIVLLIVGNDVNSTETDDAVGYINSNYKDVEVQVIYGKQPVYSYLISVE